MNKELTEKQKHIKVMGFHKTKPASESAVRSRFLRIYGKQPTENELIQFKITNPIKYN